MAPRRSFLGSTWIYSMLRTRGRNPIAKKLRCGRMVGYAKYYDHSQKGGFQITLIVLLCNKVNLCDCESQQNIGSV